MSNHFVHQQQVIDQTAKPFLEKIKKAEQNHSNELKNFLNIRE